MVYDISLEELFRLDDPVIIDVRSPSEFFEDHIPGAINVPLFLDDERKAVGTTYKSEGRQRAILQGTEFVGRRLPEIVEPILALKGKTVVLYCFRGGMRSKSVAQLMSSLGMKLYRLKGGYKSYRRHVHSQMQQIECPVPLFVLQGLTGSGKTEILQNMEYAIDLEGMAAHRSSLFGAMGKRPRSQKWFETSLLQRMKELRDAPYAIVEGESRKLGNLHIPDSFFAQMRRSPVILVTTPMDRRVEIILQDYMEKFDLSSTLAILDGMPRGISRQKVQELKDLLTSEQYHDFTAMLLEYYYDPLYSHTLDRLKPVGNFENKNSKDTATEIHSFIIRNIKDQ